MLTITLIAAAAALWAQPPPEPRCDPHRTTRRLSSASRARVGAIRWDAWHGANGTPGKVVERSLGPARWHYRLPFFAKVISDSEVSIDGSSQVVMDQEIAYAAQAGLDYWAFVTYDENDAMYELGLKHYLASKQKRALSFCLITEQGRWGNRNAYRERIARFARFLTEGTYLKVLDGRPLVYLGFINDDSIAKFWGSIEEFRKAVDEFRGLARENGAGNPYIVIMDFNPARGAKLREQLGADAISSYAAQGGESAAPYSALAAYAQRFWVRCKETGAAVVPILMAGWDRRPRVERPTPWEPYQQPGVGLDKYYESPTPTELAGHLERALMWIQDNREAAPANVALIYAWNENDEGGWLTPTLCDGALRIEALSGILKKE